MAFGEELFEEVAQNICCKEEPLTMISKPSLLLNFFGGQNEDDSYLSAQSSYSFELKI